MLGASAQAFAFLWTTEPSQEMTNDLIDVLILPHGDAADTSLELFACCFCTIWSLCLISYGAP